MSYLAFIFILSFLLISCGEDSKAKALASQLVGAWELYKEVYSDGTVDDYAPGESRMSFNSDGRATQMDEEGTVNVNYRIVGGLLELSLNGQVGTIKIEIINGELIFHDDLGDGESYKGYYRRIQ